MGRHVFVSYSRKDADYVGRLVRHLIANGLEIWTDEGIDFGSQWPRVIQAQIEGCIALLPVMSTHSLNSDWVLREILFAQELGKPILPLLLEGRRFIELIAIQDEDVTAGQMPGNRFVSALAELAGRPQPRVVETDQIGATGNPAYPALPSWSAEESLRPGTVRGDWAIFSKPSGAHEDYMIMGTSLPTNLVEGLLKTSFSGNPDNSPPGSPEELPWLSFVASMGEHPVAAITELSWSDARDFTGRRIAPTRLVTFPWKDLAAHNATYLEQYRALQRLSWHQIDSGPDAANGAGVSVELSLSTTDAHALAHQIETLSFEWTATVAALLLEGRRIAFISEERYPTLLEKIALFDAVCALLPYGFRASLTASTWATRSTHGLQMVFARRALNGQLPIRLGQPITFTPETTEARNYLDQLRRLAGQGISLATIAEHLMRAIALPDGQGALRVLASLIVPSIERSYYAGVDTHLLGEPVKSKVSAKLGNIALSSSGSPLGARRSELPLPTPTVSTMTMGLGLSMRSPGFVRIGLWGAPASGKSTFVAALPIAALQAAHGPWAVAGTTDEASEYINGSVQLLVVERKFPSATRVVNSLSWSFRGPQDGRSRAAELWSKLLRRAPQTAEFILELYDPPGGAYEITRIEDSHLDELANSHGLIYLLDPFAQDDTNFAYFFGILPRLLNRMADSGHLVNGRLPHYISVCITKFDEVGLFSRLLDTSFVGNDSRTGTPFVRSDRSEEFFDWIVEQLGHSGQMIKNSISAYFVPGRVRFFATSAVGFRLGPDRKFDANDYSNVIHRDGSPMLRGVPHPINVLEPLIDMERQIRLRRRSA